jgi:hypothetical protein
MEIAAQLATRINSESITKGVGATISAADAYPAAVQIAEAEARIDAAGRALSRNQQALAAMASQDFYRPRPEGAGLSDAPMDAEEAARVNRVIKSMEEDFT